MKNANAINEKEILELAHAELVRRLVEEYARLDANPSNALTQNRVEKLKAQIDAVAAMLNR